MSSVEEYAYTFRMIVPDKTPEELESIRDELVENDGDGNTPMVASTIDDYLMVTFNEDTEFPDQRLPYAVMLAKTALDELGVKRPIIIKAYATLKNDMRLIEIHRQIILDAESEHRTDLTDELLQFELGK